MSVVVLIATIPRRRLSCARLLQELAQQTRLPDRVALCLDGYGAAPAPPCPLPCVEYRTAQLSGPGARWRVSNDMSSDTIIVNLDDDTVLTQAPNLIAALVNAIEQGGGASAAMGRTPTGRRAEPGAVSLGRLIYGCGCGLAMRAGDLAGLQALAEQVRAGGGPDALGNMGDDDALVSALLWQKGVPIIHAATGNIFSAADTGEGSQTRLRLARGEHLEAQKRAISKVTGWPWPGFR